MEEKATVVNCRTDDYDVFVGRPSMWGNPFKIGQHGTREEVIEKYRTHLQNNPHLMQLAKEMLKGKVLGCYCKPLPCHGDVLAEFVNAEEDGDTCECHAY